MLSPLDFVLIFALLDFHKVELLQVNYINSIFGVSLNFVRLVFLQ